MSSEMLTLLTTFSCERKHTIKHRARADPAPETKSNRGILAGRKKKKNKFYFKKGFPSTEYPKLSVGDMNLREGGRKGDIEEPNHS